MIKLRDHQKKIKTQWNKNEADQICGMQVKHGSEGNLCHQMLVLERKKALK